MDFTVACIRVCLCACVKVRKRDGGLQKAHRKRGGQCFCKPGQCVSEKHVIAIVRHSMWGIIAAWHATTPNCPRHSKAQYVGCHSGPDDVLCPYCILLELVIPCIMLIWHLLVVSAATVDVLPGSARPDAHCVLIFMYIWYWSSWLVWLGHLDVS